jgi:hypothetical protein
LSDEQLERCVRADEADPLGSPIPTQVVSNGEYMPTRQTLQQQHVQARITELADGAAKKVGMSRRKFLATSGGHGRAYRRLQSI